MRRNANRSFCNKNYNEVWPLMEYDVFLLHAMFNTEFTKKNRKSILLIHWLIRTVLNSEYDQDCDAVGEMQEENRTNCSPKKHEFSVISFFKIPTQNKIEIYRPFTIVLSIRTIKTSKIRLLSKCGGSIPFAKLMSEMTFWAQYNSPDYVTESKFSGNGTFACANIHR